MKNLFDSDGNLVNDVSNKDNLEGTEAWAWLAKAFGNTTHGNYNAEILFDRSVSVLEDYEVVVRKK